MIEAFLQLGWEVVAIAPEDEYASKIEEIGSRFVPVSIQNKGVNPIKDFNTFLKFRSIYKKEKPDIILHYTVKPNIYGTLAARTLKIPAISNVSGLGTLFIRKNLVSKIGIGLYKFAFKSPKKIYFQNKDDQALFVDYKLVKKEQTGLLPGSGVDIQRFTPHCKKEKPLRVLMASRLLFDKGVVEYYEAAKKLKTIYAEVEFCLCGFVETEANLGITKQRLEIWQDEGVIHYWGSSDDMPTIFKKVDIVVLPSYREGTPKVLLEAAAMAKPIVTTNVPGCREVVVDQKNGYLCDAKDAATLAEKIEKLLQMDELDRLAMGQVGRDYVEQKFSQEIVINKYIEEIKKQTA